MAFDITNLSSVQSLLSQYTTGNATISNAPNFTDYLLDALDASNSTEQKKESNGLYDLISNSSNSTMMQSLLGTGSSSVLSKYLEQSSTGVDFLSPYTSSTSDTPATVTTEMFSEYLQSNFQAKMLKSMTAAKEKLQLNLDQYIAANANNDSEGVKLRIEQMKQNVSMVDSLLQSKTSASTTNHDLLNKLSSNSAYSKYLLTNNL